MNTNHRITGSNSSLTLSGDNTETLCWTSKDISNYNQQCILSEKPFLMGLLLLLLKARPMFPLGAGNRINLFVITLILAPLEVGGTFAHPWQARDVSPVSPEGAQAPDLMLSDRWAAASHWYLLPALGRGPPGNKAASKPIIILIQQAITLRKAPLSFSRAGSSPTHTVHRQPDKAGILVQLQIWKEHLEQILWAVSFRRVLLITVEVCADSHAHAQSINISYLGFACILLSLPMLKL